MKLSGRRAITLASIAFIGLMFGANIARAYHVTVKMEAVNMRVSGPSASPAQNLATVGGDATWWLNTDTGVITQSGSNTFTFGLDEFNTLFTLEISGMSIDAAGVATADTYSCTDGWFAQQGAFSICGGYDFFPPGDFTGNFVDDSARTIDATTCDVVVNGSPSGNGPANDYDSAPPPICLQTMFSELVSRHFTFGDGGTVEDPAPFTTGFIGPANWNPSAPLGEPGSGFRILFGIVPVPPAVWLLGSALALLTTLRRR